MKLEADVHLERGELSLVASAAVADHEIVAVVGPNGAGKTTLLRAIAGLERIDAGSIAFGADTWDAPPWTWVPPAQRRCGLLSSDPLLFPNLSVLDNIAFGPRATGTRRSVAREEAQVWLERVGAGALATRRTATLSRGEAQRVALARTLAARPAVLLLDEPLASIDAEGRLSLRRDLLEHLRAFAGPCLLVTHDPLDALALADRVVVLEGGRVTQDGPLDDVTRAPRSSWAAAMVGVNLYRGSCARGRVVLDDGGELVVADAPDGRVVVVVHPRAVALHLERPEGSPRNVWSTQVDDLQRTDGGARVSLRGAPPVVAQVTAAAVAHLSLVPGRQVWASVKASEVVVTPD